MEAQRSCYNTIEWWGRYHASNGKDANKTKVELISGVFQKVVDPLPTCPTFIFKDGWFERPVGEEECVTDAGTEDDTIAHPTSGAAVGPQPRRSSRPKLPNTRVTGNEWATP